MQELTDHTTIHTLPSLITTTLDQCQGLNQIQVVGVQETTTPQVINQIPTTTRSYHVPVTMFSIIEQPGSVETKLEPV